MNSGRAKVVPCDRGTYKHDSCDILVYLKDIPDDAVLHEMLHRKTKFYKTDFEFALEFFNQPMDERTDRLKNKIYQSVINSGGTFSDYQSPEKLISSLE